MPTWHEIMALGKSLDVLGPYPSHLAHFTEDLDVLTADAALLPQDVRCGHVLVEATIIVPGKESAITYPDTQHGAAKNSLDVLRDPSEEGPNLD